MSIVEHMQKTLDKTITLIVELQEKLDELKKNPTNLVELRDIKKKLATQERIKITLIQSIQELTPTSNALIIPTKLPTTFFSRVGTFIKKIFKSNKIESA